MISEWNAQVVDGMEADDAIAIKATELDHKAVICSLDKDFKQVPCPMYDYTKKEDEPYYTRRCYALAVQAGVDG